jgi:predicted dehydrogenase
MTSNNAFKVGILGAGNVVKRNHLPALMAMPNVEISWIADKNLNRAQEVAKSYHLSTCDLSSGLQTFPKTDIVLLAVPFGVREPYYDALSQMNAAIFVEKPFARTAAAHRKLCSTFADSQVACGFNRRAWGLVQFFKKVLDNDLFGKVRRVRFGLGLLGGIVAATHYMADAQMSGGGMLIETGVHGIDTVLYCLDAQGAELMDGRMIAENGHDIHCDGVFTLTTSKGERVPFEIEVSRMKNTINKIEFQFDNCNVSFAIFGESQLWVESKDGKLRTLLTDRSNCYPFTWHQVSREFWQTFMNGIERGEANYTSAIGSVVTTLVIEQLYGLATDSEG